MPNPPPSAPVSRLLDLNDVSGRVHISKPALRRLIEAGRFPEPIKFSDSLHRWESADVERFIASKNPNKSQETKPAPNCELGAGEDRHTTSMEGDNA